MSDCCPPTPAEATMIDCPLCAVRGASVELRAVKALLTEAALARLENVSHRFCRTSSCPAVYYDENGSFYLREDVRVRVWQKEPEGNRILCYCFGESESGIQDEVRQSGVSEVVARTRAHIDACRCACDVRNPRGVCCLGDLAAAVKRIAAESFVAKDGQ